MPESYEGFDRKAEEVAKNVIRVFDSIGLQYAAPSLKVFTEPANTLRVDVPIFFDIKQTPSLDMFGGNLAPYFSNASSVTLMLKRRYDVGVALHNILLNFGPIGEDFKMKSTSELVRIFEGFAVANNIKISREDLLDYFSVKSQKIVILLNSLREGTIIVPFSFICFVPENPADTEYYFSINEYMDRRNAEYILGPTMIRHDQAMEPSFVMPDGVPVEQLKNLFKILESKDEVKPNAIITQFLQGLAVLQTKNNLTIGPLLNSAQLVEATITTRQSDPRVKKIIQLADPHFIRYFNLPSNMSALQIASIEADDEHGISIKQYILSLNEDINYLRQFLETIRNNSPRLEHAEFLELQTGLTKYVRAIINKVSPFSKKFENEYKMLYSNTAQLLV
ncbi:MAG: hypothetical protein ACMG57_02650 [Candidatus Dojkabacteria bacterium]